MLKPGDIERINELAKKKRETGLTPEEAEEREELKKRYAESFRESLVNTLEHTYIVDGEGNKTPVGPKGKKTEH